MNISSYTGIGRKRVQQGGRGSAIAVCKILSNAARFRIVSALITAKRAKKELCVNNLASAVGASQSATSHQLALLEAHGVVVKRRMGQTICYDLAASAIAKDIECIIGVFEKKI